MSTSAAAGAVLLPVWLVARMLADLAIGDRIVKKADGPGAPGSADVHPGNPGSRL